MEIAGLVTLEDSSENFIWAASSGGRRWCRSRRRLARGDQAAEQARRIKQRPRSASAEVNRSLGHELGRVRERGRDDLGIRVGELRDRVQRKFKLAQLSRRFWAKYFDLAFLACSNRCQLVALALAFIACRQRVLNRCLHTDFSPHEGALLIGSLLRLFRIDALLLRCTFLDKSLGKLCG